jgi:cell division protein FtsW
VIARRAPDMLGTLIASGVTFWIGIEALINMAVMVGLMPFAGNALPFISAGGSNLVSTLAAIGIILNVSRQSGESVRKEEKDRRSFSAVADLRRGDGRRSVPRSRRSRRTHV